MRICLNIWTVILLLVHIAQILADADPSYDHQTKTYTANISPQSSTGLMTLTPFFSPDNSIDVETQLILNAQDSVDIGAPGFNSWIECRCENLTSGGCPVAQQRYNETFPIFTALLNSLHRGVAVRILTNYYGITCGSDGIDPLSFLALAGAQVRYFTTTTFFHAKYMSADGKRAAVSSVNFDYTSFMENREAGILMEGPATVALIQSLTSTFELDFNQSLPWPTSSYSSEDMEIIEDKSMLPISMPVKRTIKGAYIAKLKPVTDTMTVSVISSPDFAWNTISAPLNDTKYSFKLFMYQVTDYNFCDTIIQLNQLEYFKMLVAEQIYDQTDSKEAIQCYEKLFNAGVTFYKTAEHMYRYSHQKYWILDGHTVYMSTGNWGASDYPAGSMTFPPYNSGSSWRDTNRDFTLGVRNDDIVAQFEKVLSEDYQRGTRWTPSS